MEIEKPTVGNLLLNKNLTFVIPPYQRGYRWKSDRWQNLIQDILNKVTNTDKKHWMGIVITTRSEEFTRNDSYMHKYMEIIDGQQRLVTLRIWLAALIDYASEIEIALNHGELEFSQIVPQETDKAQLDQVLAGQWETKWKKYPTASSGLMHAYTYFRWVLWLGQDAILSSEPEILPTPLTNEQDRLLPLSSQWEKELEKRRNLAEADDENEYLYQFERSAVPDLDGLLRATLTDLSIVELQIERDKDEEPAEIFEALNGKRLELDQFDHIRNFIFSGISDKNERKVLHDESWKQHEAALERSTQTMKGADTFLYDFLISKGETKYQKSFNKKKTASSFMRYFASRTSGNHIIVAKNDLLPNLVSWLTVMNNGNLIQVGNDGWELDSRSKKHLQLMSALSSGPLVPILMNLTYRRFAGEITEESLARQIFALEVFLGRKILNRVGLSPLRSEMMQLSAKLGNDFTETMLIDSLIPLYPDDETIREKLLPVKINNVMRYPESAKLADNKITGHLKPNQILAIFQVIEEKREGILRKNILENNSEDLFSIEHIYPQDATLWRDELRHWAQNNSYMESRLHTIGNLGIVPKRLNSKLSNKSFREKCEIMNDPELQIPTLRVNEMWVREAQREWKMEDIDRRAEQLIDHALQYWTLPGLSSSS
jgi:hypothetical protein